MEKIYYNKDTGDYIILFQYRGENFICKMDRKSNDFIVVMDHTNASRIYNTDVISEARRLVGEDLSQSKETRDAYKTIIGTTAETTTTIKFINDLKKLKY